MRNSPRLSTRPRNGFRPSDIVRHIPKGFVVTAALLAAAGCDDREPQYLRGANNGAYSDAGIDGGTGNGNDGPDDDYDGVPNTADNCPNTVNPDQTDSNNDGVGDGCQDLQCLASNPDLDPATQGANCRGGRAVFDSDGDGVGDAEDNCPRVPNPGQQNEDTDPLGQACDLDDNNPTVQVDTSDANERPECFPGTVEAIGINVGVCRAGSRKCNNFGFWEQTLDPVAGNGEEVIGNDEDDDCDGATDEGEECDAPTAADEVTQCGVPGELNGKGVCRAGFQMCLHDGTKSDCIGAVLPSNEVLDGQDNDCDDEVDEDFRDRQCNSSLHGVCALGTSEVMLVNGHLTEVCNPNVQPREDVCNGNDDDCDGQIDEGPRGDGYANTTAGVSNPRAIPDVDQPVGIGACAAQTQQVPGNRFVCADLHSVKVNGVNPINEVCNNGTDDNCNGSVDENCPGDPVACGTTDVGECTLGTQQVNANGIISPDCNDRNGNPVVNPTEELCNGDDDDCDGATDENLGVGEDCNVIEGCTPGTKVCADDGTVRCDTSNQFIIGEAGDVVCVDTDHNGVVDNRPRPRTLPNGTPINGQTLTVGEACIGLALDANNHVIPNGDPGRCNILSRAVSSADGLGAACPSDGQRIPEVPMNLVDDDCDNEIDEDDDEGCVREGLTGVCNTPVDANNEPLGGLCHGGITTCHQGKWSPCVGAQGPVGETCNGEDDDCNDEIDDGFGIDEVCQVVGECGAGRLRCTADGEGSECSANDNAVAEACNGLDDDCDNHIDEDFAIGERCIGVGNTPGVTECNDHHNGVRCSTGVGGSNDATAPERCDGLDNDADGSTDEGFANLGEACTRACPADSPDANVGGVNVCAPDARTVVCSADVRNCAAAPAGN